MYSWEIRRNGFSHDINLAALQIREEYFRLTKQQISPETLPDAIADLIVKEFKIVRHTEQVRSYWPDIYGRPDYYEQYCYQLYFSVDGVRKVITHRDSCYMDIFNNFLSFADELKDGALVGIDVKDYLVLKSSQLK